MSGMLADVRSGARMLMRAPGFSCVAALILAAGIGGATLMFSLVHTALIRALPFDEPDRVVWLYNLRTERDRAPLSIPDVADYRQQASTLAGLASFTNWTANLTGTGTPERLEGVRVSGNFFQLLGLRPLLGRPLQPGDEELDARVTVLTHGLWIRRFGGDRGVVGSDISLNGATYTVVGVLPTGFIFPFRDAELAVPLNLRSDPRRSDRGANFLRVVARLAPTVTLRQAKADLDTIAQRLQQMYPTENARKMGVSLYPLHAEIVRDYRNTLWTLFAAVAVLLAVGCGNLANLLLLRNASRQGEFAVRLSLGASRGALMRLLLTEAAILALAGGVLGIGLAASGLAAWQAWGPANFPRMTEVGLNWQVVLFAILVSGISALACGLVPAWLTSRNIAQELRATTRSITAGSAALRRVFVAGQLAAAAMLLVGMVTMARGFARLERVAPGFTPDQTLSIQLSLTPGVYRERASLIRFAEGLEQRINAIPGVQSAGLVSLLPLSGLLSTMDIAFPDRPAPPPDEVPQAHFRVASTGYFSAAGIPIIQGRAFADRDRADTQYVAIVSSTFAERHWPGEPAVGKAVQLVQPGGLILLDVVGVVSDVKHFTLDAPPTADLYVPLQQMPPSQAQFLAARMFWVVRAHGEQSTLASAVRAAVLQVDPGVASSGARTLASVVSTSLGAHRMTAQLMAAFGQVASVLCALGVYAVAAFSARTRRRELAIRTALGAQRWDLTALLLRNEMWPVIVGIVVGLSAALVMAPQLFGSAFETDPRDAATYLGVGGGLLVVGMIASYHPVLRAGRANPAEVLRA